MISLGQSAKESRRAGINSLWWGWVAAPSWWLLQFEIRYAAVHWACAHGFSGAVLQAGIVALVVAAAIVAWSVRCYTISRDDETMRFAAVGGIWISAGFAALVAIQLLPDLYIEVCRI